jgi:hypothetical protein
MSIIDLIFMQIMIGDFLKEKFSILKMLIFIIFKISKEVA